MGSVRGVFSVPGTRFDAGVIPAGDVAERPGNEKLKLPGGSRVGLLAELPVAKDPADREKLKILMSKAYALEEEMLEFAEARFAEQRADREAAHEQAKRAVREQGAVIEKLNQTVIDEGREFLQADNARHLASAAAHDAEVNLKGLSRFASKAEVASAEKRVTEANKKFEVTQAKAAEWGQHCNFLKTASVPAEQKKLGALIEAEMELAAQLEGRDPVLAKFGFVQR